MHHETETPYEHAKRWLEMLGQSTARLRDIDSKLIELDMIADDMRGQRFDLPNVRGLSDVAGDRIGALISSRLERRDELREERELLALATANGWRLLLEVARANDDPKVKRGAAYILARHYRGMKAKDAARLLGMSRSTAHTYQGQFTQALLDYAPDKFTGEQLPYGYEFARGEVSAHNVTCGRRRGA